MKTTETTPNLDKAEKQTAEEREVLDMKSVLEDYSLTELKFKACQNHLLGNFDKDKQYHILDIIYPELVNIHKVLEVRTPEQYRASAKLESITLNFVVNFVRTKDGKISATLVLEEKFVIAKNIESVIATPIKALVGEDDVEFSAKVRKAFNIFNKSELDEKNLFESYISTPIELVTEIIKKREMLEILSSNREKLEAEYVNSLIDELKSTELGAEIVKDFLVLVAENKIHKTEENRAQNLKAILDFVLDKHIEKHALDKALFAMIVQKRSDFLGQAKQEAFQFMQTQKKGIKGFIGTKTKLEQELSPPKAPPPRPAPPKMTTLAPFNPAPAPRPAPASHPSSAPRPSPTPSGAPALVGAPKSQGTRALKVDFGAQAKGLSGKQPFRFPKTASGKEQKEPRQKSEPKENAQGLLKPKLQAKTLSSPILKRALEEKENVDLNIEQLAKNQVLKVNFAIYDVAGSTALMSYTAKLVEQKVEIRGAEVVKQTTIKEIKQTFADELTR